MNYAISPAVEHEECVRFPGSELSRIQGWLRERFPYHPYIYFGLSGAALVHDALKNQHRTCAVMPAFICPSLSEAILSAGMRLIHIDADRIDADRLTMHADAATLETYLECGDASDTVLLMDHSFGYPFPGLRHLRLRFPKLLVIEDCARALGARVRGQFPGEHSDWVLLSMYKTILGPRNGAILLTKTPIPARNDRSVRVTVRERAATMTPVRFLNDFLKRTTRGLTPRRIGLTSPGWTPHYGFPSDLCLARFGAELNDFENRACIRNSIAEEFRHGLSRMPGIELIKVASGCQPADHFVSFRIQKAGVRDRILTRLYRRGLFLSGTWPIVPAHYKCFSETFPAGHAASEFLAEHMVHIPVALFHRGRERKRLIRVLGDLMCEVESHAR